MEDVRPLRPIKLPVRRRPRRWLRLLAVAVVPIAFIIAALLRYWVDLMWFDELGQRSVFTTRLQWSLVVGLVVAIITCAAFYASFFVARRVGKNDLFVPFLQAAHAEAPDQPVVPHFIMRPVLLTVAILAGVIGGIAAGAQWPTVLAFIGRSSFGVRDPLFHHDLSFYVFTLPMMEMVASTLQTIIVMATMATVLAYVAMGVIRYTPVPRIARPAVMHLAVLLACFLVVQALQFRISAWNLVNSEHGAATGAGYTDIHARLPGAWVMMAASLLAAGAIVWYARRLRWRVLIGVVVGWGALALITVAVLPGIMQSASVSPNELQRERPVLGHNIRFTQLGYGLDNIADRPFTDEAALSADEFADNSTTTSNIRLWSPDVLDETLQQIQEFRPYYRFNGVDVDRYTIDGRYRQVMLAAREVGVDRLTSSSWLNTHLQFTHGYGVVGAWPDRATKQGRPELFLRDIPPVPSGQTDVQVKRPELYYGEEPDNYVIVRSREREFDYPDGNNNKYTSYEGRGGIPIGNVMRRLAYAVKFNDQKFLLTSSITGSSRVMFRRNVSERVHELAPFLQTDGDPYLVVRKSGRLSWVLDAYTTTDRMPYSDFSSLTGGGRINYVRNSVKAVIDAYDGSVKLYDVSDGDDPILKTWRRIFPTLFVDGDTMPRELVAHLRYPEDMFNVQTDKWLTYHMGEVSSGGKVSTDSVQTYYNREDVWAIPELDGSPLESFYVLAKLPGEKAEEMLLVRPIVPSGKKNLIAYMGARMDPGHYGEVFNLKLSKQSLTQGPQQVSARIRQTSEIAEQLTLWNKGGTKPRFGNLLVLPIERSLLYVQPIYLESEEAQLPEFERVVLVLGDTVAWGVDFDAALAELLRKRGEEPAADADPKDDEPGDANPPKGTGAKLTERELQQVVAGVGASYDKAIACQRAGDWKCYGEETARIGELLRSAGVGGTAAEPNGEG